MKTIRFSRIRLLMIIVSLVLIGAGAVTTVLRGGFNLGIDFQAGLSMRVEIDASANPSSETVRGSLSDLSGVTVQTVGSEGIHQFSIRMSDPGDVESFNSVAAGQIMDALADEFGAGNVEELEVSFVGPRFSQDLTQNMILITILALAVILIYIWIRFRLGYATAAIAALVHDVAFMAVFIGTTQIEVSTATIAAVLTIIGYSLNDTIVIFDRVRENEHVMRESGMETIINTSITQSLSRTLITSVTTLLAVTAIYIFATGPVQLFALNMIIGVVIGTYSSIFIASPVFYGLYQSGRKRRTRKDRERHGAPTAAKSSDSPRATAAQQQSVTEADKQRVIDEINRKRAASGSRSTSRSQRKKK